MYAKIFSQIYDGTLCTNGPWEALVTFQQMLILADQEGGVDMTIPAIARRTTIPREIIERGIEALMLPDPESRTPTEEGRRIVPLSEGRAWGWRIVNYNKYRQIKREQDRRDYHREYYHSKRKASSTDPQHVSTIPPIAEAKAEAEAEAKAVESDSTAVGAHGDEAPRKRSAEAKKPRAARLPQDWTLPKSWGEWAVSELGMQPAAVRTEAAKFADHWHAKAGRDAAKLDWLATWRNWCRTTLERAPRPLPGRRQPAPAQTDAQRTAEVRRLLGFDAIDGDVIEGGGHAR